MTIWLDAQLSPLIISWITDEFQIDAVHIRDIGLRDASDRDIFFEAKRANAIIMTKDSDFDDLITKNGTPPQILLLTCGNTSNKNLKIILKKSLKQAIRHIENGEGIVEISNII